MKRLIGFRTIRDMCDSTLGKSKCMDQRNRGKVPFTCGKCCAKDCPIWRKLATAPKTST